ncbi:MAG: oligosaccharide flippase family protein [Bacteroidetes bacterium]|nr:oligosaccharide flippase family protein [Bacteroidota bacterium]
MFEQLKRLGADTAIYGISTILARLLNFALVPLYANILTTSEFGIVANVYSYIGFIIIFYSFGMESSYFRYASAKEIGSDKDNFSTPFLSVAIVSGLFSLLMLFFAEPLTSVFQIDAGLSRIILYTSGILFFDAAVMIPYASLRLQRKAKFFAGTKIFNILLTVILNIITVYYLRWGIEGIFISNLAASFCTFLFLIPVTLRQIEFSFHPGLMKELLKFGLPIVPVGVSGILLQLVDRPILKMLMDDSAVGIYQANYRLGIFMALITGMFEFAWRPFFLSHAKDPEAKILFSRVMTYYLLLCSFIFLLLSFFLEDVIRYKFFGKKYILPPEYWPGLEIVPFVLLSYIFMGIGTNLNAGIQIEKKTKYLFPTSLSGSVTKIALTFLLVPIFGIMGAAYATLAGYIMVEVTLFFVVQKFYFIEYEYVRIGKLALSVAVAFAVVTMFDLNVIMKTALFLLWIGGLVMIGFFTVSELNRVKRLFWKST